MSDVFDALPGTLLRVADVMPALARYWQEADTDAPTSRASQMNLVVAFGSRLSAKAAEEQLEQAFALSRRYPCRIVVLCPDEAPEAPTRARLHIVCFPSGKGRERRCGEALILGFPAGMPRDALESQVTVWLESDLPVYVWMHGVDLDEADRYSTLVRSARRVVFDSSLLRQEGVAAIVGKCSPARDLAQSRILPVRQALGQFLSAYEPEVLVRGLQRVVVRHAPSRIGEARHLMLWMRDRLDEIALRHGRRADADFRVQETPDCDTCLSTEWTYADGGSFRWDHAASGSGAHIAADIGGVRYEHPLRVAFPDQPTALAEALFF